eukprot:gb/GECH01001948.1/.p1 GENE.gb/GECH01001948.1/~~gb/GECH01001948.1/.p1  ORF type:complete len:1428 (+),score=196.76 gb/GECH01001948.1/:1-4284(+)
MLKETISVKNNSNVGRGKNILCFASDTGGVVTLLYFLFEIFLSILSTISDDISLGNLQTSTIQNIFPTSFMLRLAEFRNTHFILYYVIIGFIVVGALQMAWRSLYRRRSLFRRMLNLISNLLTKPINVPLVMLIFHMAVILQAAGHLLGRQFLLLYSPYSISISILDYFKYLSQTLLEANKDLFYLIQEAPIVLTLPVSVLFITGTIRVLNATSIVSKTIQFFNSIIKQMIKRVSHLFFTASFPMRPIWILMALQSPSFGNYSMFKFSVYLSKLAYITLEYSISWLNLTVVVISTIFITTACILFKKTFSQERQGKAMDGKITVDDVSRLSSATVSRIFQVRNVGDIQKVLQLARREQVSVSVQGECHSMGGHTIAPEGYIISMKHYKKVIKYNEEDQLVTVEPGATWNDLILYLNQYGMSPMTMQSYSSFSIGGTLSVNAHGITNDEGMHASVENLDVILWDGRHVSCSRKENSELFSLVLGGYGLFGIISAATLRVVANTQLRMDMIRLSRRNFVENYSKFLSNDRCEVKLARINISNPEEIFLFVFQRNSDQPTLSHLDSSPGSVSNASKLLYKWVVPLQAFKKLRFLIEAFQHRPMDWNSSEDTRGLGIVTRNTLMYETAVPMAQLYSPLIRLDDTFILQEYFVPRDKFMEWMNSVYSVISAKYPQCSLLNITIRYLYPDHTTSLPYAKKEMFAFVLYWRLKRSEDAERQIASVHRQMIESTLALDGTFYLPYRHHYNKQQLLESYPEINEFFEKKIQYDPYTIFSNKWYKRYGKNPDPIDRVELSQIVTKEEQEENASLEREGEFSERNVPLVKERRKDSLTRIVKDESLWFKFREFIKNVFNVEDQPTLCAELSTSVWDPHNDNDMDVYRDLKSRLDNRFLASYFNLRKSIKLLRQLLDQKQEISEEAIQIIRQLGVSSLNGYACFGDPGRLVTNLKSRINLNGQVYIVHDKQRGFLDVIERGTLSLPGVFVPIDYNNASDPKEIPSNSCDLVTVNMGFHHFKQQQLADVMSGIRRILRPGGILLFREHDAREELVPVLDMAHMIFNVVTGVSPEDEAKEIRAFRTLENWRKIATKIGLEDMMLYGLQHDDPTEDFMLCFRKKPTEETNNTKSNLLPKQNQEQLLVPKVRHWDQKDKIIQTVREHIYFNQGKDSWIHHDIIGTYFRLPEWMLVRMTQQLGEYMNHTVWYEFPFFKYIVLYWRILGLEFESAANEHSTFSALTCYGFWMNIVIGLVFTIICTQFGIIGNLISSGQQASQFHIVEKEQFLVECHQEVNWSLIDERIESFLIPNSSFYLITIPCHTPFTEILSKIAISQSHNARFISISDRTGRLQVEVSILTSKKNAINNVDDELWKWLQFELPETNLLFDYQYPQGVNQYFSNEYEWTQVILSVPVSHLIEVIDMIEKKENVKLKQVNDIFI